MLSNNVADGVLTVISKNDIFGSMRITSVWSDKPKRATWCAAPRFMIQLPRVLKWWSNKMCPGKLLFAMAQQSVKSVASLKQFNGVVLCALMAFTIDGTFELNESTFGFLMKNSLQRGYSAWLAMLFKLLLRQILANFDEFSVFNTQTKSLIIPIVLSRYLKLMCSCMTPGLMVWMNFIFDEAHWLWILFESDNLAGASGLCNQIFKFLKL